MRPRLVVFRGSKTFSLQLVDDATARVLATVTTQGKEKNVTSIAVAAKLGTELAKTAKVQKVAAVVFDRAGYRYHGQVKAAVDAVREGGITV